jgi:hypothetical protein
MDGMDETAKLHLPLIMPSQALKHITHNEALARLDALVQLSVITRALGTPPGTPAEGDRYIVPAGAGGAWSGWDGDLAVFLGGGWERIAPASGWLAYVADEAKLAVRDGGAWEPLAASFAADEIACLPTGGLGATDVQAAIAALADAAAGTMRILAQSAVGATLSGSTAETALASVSIPAGAMGANGFIRVTSQWSNNNNGNNKTGRIRFGGLSGTLYFIFTNSTQITYLDVPRTISNVNAENAQKGRGTQATGAGGSGNAIVTSTLDTSAAVELVFTGQLANAADSLVLESYVVELFHAA